jgi:hypothetical protein
MVRSRVLVRYGHRLVIGVSVGERKYNRLKVAFEGFAVRRVADLVA